MTSPLQQKLRINGPVVITANRLSDGVVVHRTANGGWSEEFSDAQVFFGAEEAQAALKAAQLDELRVIGSYVAPVDASGAIVIPGNLRELIRKGGPTFALPSDASFSSNRNAKRDRARAAA